MTRRPILAVLAALALAPIETVAEEPAARLPVEVGDVSVWVADPARTGLNTASAYRNGMPSVVGTSRPRAEKEAAAGLFPIAPISFIQFFGEPRRGVDVDLKIRSGNFLAHWPIGEERAGRIRWLGSDLLAEPPADVPPAHLPADGGLLVRLREAAGALYLKNGARVERFIAYDAEPTLSIPVALRGGPDEYSIQNMTGRRLLDVAVIAPTARGVRIGWLDELPAAASSSSATEPAEPSRKPDSPPTRPEEVFEEAAKPDSPTPPGPRPLPEPADPELRARVDQFLNQRVTAVVASAPRRELLGLVASRARLRLEFDEEALKAAKVDLAAATSLKAADAPARDLLADLLGAAGLSYRVTNEGRLLVTTAERLAAAAEKAGGVEPGPPVKLGMSQPVKPGDPSHRALGRDALARRLEGRGIRKEVVAEILDSFAKDLFEPNEVVALVHLSREAIDEAVPLDVFPVPRKLARTALVVVRGIDPGLQDRARALVRVLGDDSWKVREKAEADLRGLGPAAVPALTEALRDKDAEIVFRVERLLKGLGRDVPVP